MLLSRFPGGQAIPTLTNPAGPEDIADGKQVIGPDGTTMEGTGMLADTLISGADSITEFSSDVTTLSRGAFAYASIKTFRFPNVIEAGEYAFAASQAKAVSLPSATKIGDYAFQNCVVNLEDICFPSATSVGNHAFSGCDCLTTVVLPMAEEIGGSAFQNCVCLESVSLPSARKIGNSAFERCMHFLEKLDFPVAEQIGANAFDGCSVLTAVIIRSQTVCELSSSGAFSSTPIASGTGYIYVPAALVDSYKAATNWTVYADQIRAIEDYPDICGV